MSVHCNFSVSFICDVSLVSLQMKSELCAYPGQSYIPVCMVGMGCCLPHCCLPELPAVADDSATVADDCDLAANDTWCEMWHEYVYVQTFPGHKLQLTEVVSIVSEH